MSKPVKTSRTDIIAMALPLFARSGVDAVSMRDIGRAVGLSPAALYHHFSDKEQLYLETLRHCFEGKFMPPLAGIAADAGPWERLEVLVSSFTATQARDEDLRRLMQWVMLDTDERRLRLLIDNVFRELEQFLRALVAELAPAATPALVAVLIMSLVTHPYTSVGIRRLTRDYLPEHDDPALVSRHIMALLRGGIDALNKTR